MIPCDAIPYIIPATDWISFTQPVLLPPSPHSSASLSSAPQHCICSCIWVCDCDCDCDCIGDYLAACKTNEHSIIVFLLWLLLHLSFDLMWWNWMDCNGMEWPIPAEPRRVGMGWDGMAWNGQLRWSRSVKGCSMCVPPDHWSLTTLHNFLIAYLVCITTIHIHALNTMIESSWGFSYCRCSNAKYILYYMYYIYYIYCTIRTMYAYQRMNLCRQIYKYSLLSIHNISTIINLWEVTTRSALVWRQRYIFDSLWIKIRYNNLNFNLLQFI